MKSHFIHEVYNNDLDLLFIITVFNGQKFLQTVY